jgi:uncharacterized membrane protein YphA (DoxX/SURF4 family)
MGGYFCLVVPFLSITARLLLAFVLLIAGISKLTDRRGFRAALRDFGVRERLARALAIVVPVAELATAGALIPGPSAQWGGLAAAVLLVAFTAAITANIARGRHPECKCFGGLHTSTTGPRALVRNAFLVVLAALVVTDSWAGSPDSAWDALADRGAGGAVLAGIVSGLGALVIARNDLVLTRLHRFRSLRRLRKAILLPAQMRVAEAMARLRVALGRPRRGLPVGSEARFFMLPTLDGEVLDLDTLLEDGKPMLLLFLDRASDGGDELLAASAAWRAGHASELTIAIVSRGTHEKNAQAMNGHGPVLLQKHREMLESYRVDVTPSAVLVTPDGKIASAPAAGKAEISELVATIVAGERA